MKLTVSWNNDKNDEKLPTAVWRNENVDNHLKRCWAHDNSGKNL